MSNYVLEPEAIQALAETYETELPENILQQALSSIPNLTFACSFGAEDMVIVDLLMKLKADINIFYLDTDVLFPETYELIDQVIQRYSIQNITRVRPALSLAQQAKAHGDKLWAVNPNKCCSIRKVEPLARHLKAYDGWITGIRRDQAPTRAHAQAFEIDKKFGLLKVNPLILWTEEDVWNYIRKNNVLYNPLHDQGYPSIGCLHCTLPVKPGEDSRSGRWAGFTKTECGLHK